MSVVKMSLSQLNFIPKVLTTPFQRKSEKDISPITPPSSSLDVVDNHTQYKNPFEMNSEENRLRTFDNYPCDFMDKHKLAKTGMFYTGHEDKCKCYFCDVEIGRWERQDCPLGEHMRFSQNCPLLRRRHTDNVPIDQESLNSILPPVSYDVCGLNDTMMIPPVVITPTLVLSSSSHNHQSDEISSSVTPVSASVTTTKTYYPDHPEYAVISARLRSFAEWPRRLKQKPAELSAAGFFYTGTGDRVKCFSCGGGLKDWDDGDDPWEQHALWLSNCNFLKLIKGESFIKSTQDKYSSTKNSAPSTSSECNSQDVDETPASTSSSIVSAQQSVESNDPKIRLSTECEKRESQGDDQHSSRVEDDDENNVSKPTEDSRLCKICFAQEYNTLFIPCGHVVACANCAMSVTKCPLCRKPFTNIVRAYFS